MQIVKYSTEKNPDTIRMAFVNVDDPVFASHYVSSLLKAHGYSNVFIHDAEVTSKNVFINPEISGIAF